MHTVIASHCTGCELCVAACPVDCIHMAPWPEAMPVPSSLQNRSRYQNHLTRRARESEQRESELRHLKDQGDPNASARR
jgi:electron transport complex protein RnfB